VGPRLGSGELVAQARRSARTDAGQRELSAQPSRIGSSTPRPSARTHSAGAGDRSSISCVRTLAPARGSSVISWPCRRSSARKTSAVVTPYARCPINDGKDAPTSWIDQLYASPMNNENSVSWPRNHHTRPYTSPHATAEPAFDDSRENSTP